MVFPLPLIPSYLNFQTKEIKRIFLKYYLFSILFISFPLSKGLSLPPTRLWGILFQSTTCQLNRLSTYVIYKSHMTYKKCHVTKIHVNSLFKYHVMGWKRIFSNRVECKLFPLPKGNNVYFQLGFEESSSNPLHGK